MTIDHLGLRLVAADTCGLNREENFRPIAADQALMIKICRAPDFVHVIVTGEIDIATATPFRERLFTLAAGGGLVVADLDQRGLLDSTLIVWMGEFGRTPRINQDGGRDHWPKSWSIVMGGAGLKGGQAIGKTDKDGVEIVDRPVGVMDVVATMTKAMGIDPATQYTTPRGRPIKVVDGGKPITELTG